jgi:hypothetical protein
MKNWLARSSWQGVGVIVAVISVLVSALITYDIYDRSSQFSELTVEEGYSSSPLVFGKAMEGRLAMQVDGKTVQSLTAYYYTIRNTGRSPIRKSD